MSNAPTDENRDAGHRSPRPEDAALQQPENDQRGADAEQYRAFDIDPMLATHHFLGESPVQRPCSEPAKRDIDKEDPAPVEIVDEDPAQCWAHDCRDCPDAGDVALNPSAFGNRIDVADDGHRGWLYSAGSKALECAECDECRHAPGDAAQNGAKDEQADADEHDRFTADQVGELGEDRYRHCLRQQVDRKQPGKLSETTKIIDDRRDRGGEDRRVDRDQPDAQHHRSQDRAAFGTEADRGARDALLLGRLGHVERNRRSTVSHSRIQ